MAQSHVKLLPRSTWNGSSAQRPCRLGCRGGFLVSPTS
jgi:hypothetical protein